jgi:hypothetical protein
LIAKIIVIFLTGSPMLISLENLVIIPALVLDDGLITVVGKTLFPRADAVAPTGER